MRALYAALAVLIASPAMAHQLWWNRTTTYSNGDQIDITDTVTYRLEWTDGNEDFSELEGSRTTQAASVTVPDPVGLLRCYRVIAVVAEEGESEPSNTWCKDMRPEAPVRRPAAPTNLSGN